MSPEQRAAYLTVRQTLDGAISEREFQAQIIKLAKLLGWRVSHPWLSIKSAAGYPDIIAVRDGRMLAIEVKTERGKVTGPQQQWLDALAGVPGVTAIVCRPHDWGELVWILEG